MIITLRNTNFVWLLFLASLYVFLGAELKNPGSFFVTSLFIFVTSVISDLKLISQQFQKKL